MKRHGFGGVLRTALLAAISAIGALFLPAAASAGGRSYTLRLLAARRPTYIDAAPVPAQPHGGHFPFAASGIRDGTPRWTMRVHLPTDFADNFHYWVIGVKVGRKVYHVKIHVLPPGARGAKIRTGTSASVAAGAQLAVAASVNGVVDLGMPPWN